jgi:hypothetical protein
VCFMTKKTLKFILIKKYKFDDRHYYTDNTLNTS